MNLELFDAVGALVGALDAFEPLWGVIVGAAVKFAAVGADVGAFDGALVGALDTFEPLWGVMVGAAVKFAAVGALVGAEEPL